MYNVLAEAKSNNDIDKKIYDNLCEMCDLVIIKISKNSPFQDYYRKARITPMAFIPIEEQLEKEKRNTQKKVEKAINKTIDETRIQDIKLFMESTGETFEKVCDMLEITDEDIVRYRKML